MNQKSISRRSSVTQKPKTKTHKPKTDMTTLRVMKDSEIDFSDIPPITPAMFARGVVRRGLKPIVKKDLLTLRVDSDVLSWFKGHGRGYQTQINELLREYMQASLAHAASSR